MPASGFPKPGRVFDAKFASLRVESGLINLPEAACQSSIDLSFFCKFRQGRHIGFDGYSHHVGRLGRQTGGMHHLHRQLCFSNRELPLQGIRPPRLFRGRSLQVPYLRRGIGHRAIKTVP